MIDVTFEHWRYLFADEELIRYGSPHFDRKSAGQALSSAVRANATLAHSCALQFNEKLILCANEAFPEAAVADPLADLEVWDEWRTGIRTFPYPGRYGRLGIKRQDTKTNSTSSTGVIGEIMAGLFAQAAIAPWVLVRVIRRWPDFIFYVRNDRYAFVEAKAFTGVPGGGGAAPHIPDALLGDCVVDAVHQLNADPFVQIWGAFTHIQQITPMRLNVTFLELDVGDDRRNNVQKRVLPHAVLLGLAERALRRAVTEVRPDELKPLRLTDRRPSRRERQQLERILVPAAMHQIEELLVDERVRTAVLASPKLIEEELTRLIRHASIPAEGEGQRIYSAREKATAESLSFVRNVGTQGLYVADIGLDEQYAITNDWESRWENSNQPWKTKMDVDLWRCGGAIFAIGNKQEDDALFRH